MKAAQIIGERSIVSVVYEEYISQKKAPSWEEKLKTIVLHRHIARKEILTGDRSIKHQIKQLERFLKRKT